MGCLESMDCLILGIDCSTRYTAVGCVKGDRVVGEMSFDIGRYQSAFLPDLVENLLNFGGFTLTDVDAVAATIGPGYFTGVRVGLSYAMALAFALEVPIIPIVSLDALAYELIYVKDAVVIPVIWARGREYYASILESTGEDLAELKSPGVYDERAILSFANNYVKESRQVFIVGDDIARFQVKPEEVHLILRSIRGGNVAKLGFKHRREAKRPSEVNALYIREPYK